MVAVHVGPLWDDGEVVGATMIARDITAEKKAGELKDNLLRDVAHELMTPLAKAQLSMELLLSRLDREPADPGDLPRYGGLALDGVQRLTHMARAILDLSRLEAGTRFIAGERVYMGELMASVVQDMEPLASAKGLTLAARVAEPLPPVTGDGEKLARALRNLVDNAIKCSAAGQIEIAVEGRQDEIEVSVRDEGRGIEPGNLYRVFDRFFQEDPLKAGLGLGLPICKAIVEAHGGRIWAESPGKGATLRFTLPAGGRTAV
jgi:signal transduction histidine kinase